jgi:hypothetical protein
VRAVGTPIAAGRGFTLTPLNRSALTALHNDHGSDGGGGIPLSRIFMVAVRYAWSAFPPCVVRNQLGLPVAPFEHNITSHHGTLHSIPVQ